MGEPAPCADYDPHSSWSNKAVILIKLPGFSVSDNARIAWKDENKLSSLGELMKSSSRPQYELGWESVKKRSKSIMDYGATPIYYEIMLINLALCLANMDASYFMVCFN